LQVRKLAVQIKLNNMMHESSFGISLVFSRFLPIVS